MSDRHNSLLRPFADAVNQTIGEHLNAPYQRKNQERAVWGTWLIASGIYFMNNFVVRNDIDAGRLVVAFIRDPQRTAAAVGTPFIIWCLMILFGSLWVVLGVRNARGPREFMGAFWSLCFLGGCVYALIHGAYVDGAPVANWYLRGFYVATLTASLMALFLFTRGTGGNALRLIRRQIVRNAITWRPARRRRP